MNVFHASDPTLPDFQSVLNALMQTSWSGQQHTAVKGVIQRVTADQFLNRLIVLANDSAVDSQVRAQAFLTIQALASWVSRPQGQMESDWKAFYEQARQTIAVMMRDPSALKPGQLQPVPPGSPIGN